MYDFWIGLIDESWWFENLLIWPIFFVWLNRLLLYILFWLWASMNCWFSLQFKLLLRIYMFSLISSKFCLILNFFSNLFGLIVLTIKIFNSIFWSWIYRQLIFLRLRLIILFLISLKRIKFSWRSLSLNFYRFWFIWLKIWSNIKAFLILLLMCYRCRS